MFSTIRSVRPAILAAALLATGCAASAVAGGSFDPAANVVRPAASLEFQNLNPAIAMADAYGDRGTGAQACFAGGRP